MVSGWGDESGSNTSADPGTYILAAIVLDDADVESARSTMNQALLKGQQKVHWRDESDARRLRLVRVVAAIPCVGLAVVRCSAGERPERQRRKCLEVLVPHLHANGCDLLTLESRGRADDRRDIQMVSHLRQRRDISSIEVQHMPGKRDPLLWIPDVLCGSIVSARTGERAYLSLLEAGIGVEIIDA